MSCAIVPCKAASAPRDVAAVRMFVVKCDRLCVAGLMYLFRVAYVWTRGRAWLRDQESRDAQPSLRIRVLVFVCPRAFV